MKEMEERVPEQESEREKKMKEEECLRMREERVTRRGRNMKGKKV